MGGWGFGGGIFGFERTAWEGEGWRFGFSWRWGYLGWVFVFVVEYGACYGLLKLAGRFFGCLADGFNCHVSSCT